MKGEGMNSKCDHKKTQILGPLQSDYIPESWEWCEICGAVRVAHPRAPWKIPGEPLPQPGDVIEFAFPRSWFLIKKKGDKWWASWCSFVHGTSWGRKGWDDLSTLIEDMVDQYGERPRIIGNLKDMEGK